MANTRTTPQTLLIRTKTTPTAGFIFYWIADRAVIKM